jgi:cysteine desulfurase
MPTFAYLDHAASTPVDPRVVASMNEALVAGGANPAAIHAPGRAAAQRMEAARAEVAALVGASPRDLVFTSGATEANNLAILGHAQGWAALRGRPGHLVSLATEHKSVLGPLRRLRATGWRVTLLAPDGDGRLAPQALAAVLEPDTALVSLLWVNNETGVVQDIDTLAQLCRAHQVAVHVDAAQAAGKLPVSCAGLDYLAFTAHKFGGPPGIGALVVAPSRRAQLVPQLLGGGQERGLRSGTPAEHQVAGFAAACRIAVAEGVGMAGHMLALRERLWTGLRDLPDAQLNGASAPRVCGILNVTFRGIEGESLVAGLDAELAVSPGSACDSASGEPSFVLRAMGRDREEAQSSLRFSLAPSSTADEVDLAIAAVRREHGRLRALSPAAPPPTADWAAAGAQVISGEAGAERLGAWVRWHWRIAGDRVAEARFQVYGCPAVLAATQYLAAQLPGLERGGALPGTPALWLEAVNSPVEKLGRMLIIEDAARATMLEFECRFR